MRKNVLIIILLLCFLANSTFALLGARPMGMGEAFTAVADDANAPYWNPAGLALNPEVSLSGSTMLNNRNTWIGDNVLNLKLCYEARMNPFEWIAGVGLASILAFRGAEYLSESGLLKKGWGRSGEVVSREESLAEKVEGTQEVVSLKQKVKEEAKEIARGMIGGAKELAKEAIEEEVRYRHRRNYFFGWSSPWYRPRFFQKEPGTKAQFALGLSWLNDYNPPHNEKTNWYSLSVASGFEQRIALGGNVNLYDIRKIDADIRGIGADLDLGFLAKPVEYISLGIAVKGILTTDMYWQTGEITRAYKMLVNAGLAVTPLPFLILAADVHNLFRQEQTYHYGAELKLLPEVTLRAGLSDNNKTAGVSINLGNLILDYAYLGGAFLRTQMLGVAWRF